MHPLSFFHPNCARDQDRPPPSAACRSHGRRRRAILRGLSLGWLTLLLQPNILRGRGGSPGRPTHCVGRSNPIRTTTLTRRADLGRGSRRFGRVAHGRAGVGNLTAGAAPRLHLHWPGAGIPAAQALLQHNPLEAISWSPLPIERCDDGNSALGRGLPRSFCLFTPAPELAGTVIAAPQGHCVEMERPCSVSVSESLLPLHDGGGCKQKDIHMIRDSDRLGSAHRRLLRCAGMGDLKLMCRAAATRSSRSIDRQDDAGPIPTDARWQPRVRDRREDRQ
jgi:hypothetical protein